MASTDPELEPVGDLQAACIFERHPANPILTPAMMPVDALLTYNAAVAWFGGRYVMLIRNDYGTREPLQRASHVMLATSDDGVSWDIDPEPRRFWDDNSRCPYDPRMHVIDGRLWTTFAVSTPQGVESILTVTDDLEQFEIVSRTEPDNRDHVLFPEPLPDPSGRRDALWVRLDRPFPMYHGGNEQFDIWLSRSPDLRYWGDHRVLLKLDDVPYANVKLGAGTPPIRTERGWLTLFHAVDEDPERQGGWEGDWCRRYTAGALLLDLDDPARIVGLSRRPVLVPEADYETDAVDTYRPNVVFPTALLPESDGRAKLYYGISDSCMGLATGRIDAILAACEPYEPHNM